MFITDPLWGGDPHLMELVSLGCTLRFSPSSALGRVSCLLSLSLLGGLGEVNFIIASEVWLARGCPPMIIYMAIIIKGAREYRTHDIPTSARIGEDLSCKIVNLLTLSRDLVDIAIV